MTTELNLRPPPDPPAETTSVETSNLSELVLYANGGSQPAELGDQVAAALKDVARLARGFALRLAAVLAAIAVLFYLFRASLFVSDVYYYNRHIPIFLDRFLDRIDDKHIEFLKKFADSLFAAFVVVLVTKAACFNPVAINAQMLLRFLNILAVTYVVRVLSVVFTTIPSSYPHCTPYALKETPWQTFVSMIFRRRGEVTCSGLLFSAKAQVAILGLIMVAHSSSAIFTFLLFIFSVVVSVAIVATKRHYSVDVMFSLVFSAFFHYVYFAQMDACGVHFLNRLNGHYADADHGLELTILEKSVLSKMVGAVEQIPLVITLGLKLKRLSKAVEEEGLKDPKLLKKLRRAVFLFGIEECDDVLDLYRGSYRLSRKYCHKLASKLTRRTRNRDT